MKAHKIPRIHATDVKIEIAADTAKLTHLPTKIIIQWTIGSYPNTHIYTGVTSYKKGAIANALDIWLHRRHPDLVYYNHNTDIDTLTSSLSLLLRRTRHKHHLTLISAALHAGISPTTLHRIETGQTTPSLPVLRRLLTVYSITLTIADEIIATI